MKKITLEESIKNLQSLAVFMENMPDEYKEINKTQLEFLLELEQRRRNDDRATINVLRRYEADVMRTARQDLSQIDQLTNAAIGAAGEAGELAELVKKHRYQGHSLEREKWLEESGDTLFFITLGLLEMGCTLEECIENNTRKRYKRYPSGFEIDRSINRGER